MRCAVLGSPIAHSLSPALHSAAYAHLDLDWTYAALLVDSDGLEQFIDSLDRSWRGLSLTMPLTRTVVPLVDSLDYWAQLSGVANTLVLDPRRRLGFNTDAPGAMAAVRERLRDPVRSALVVGGGATATSVLLALVELGCTTARLLVRDIDRAEKTVAAVRAHPRSPEISVSTIAGAAEIEADIVVSTVPAAAQAPELLAACAGASAVFEVVYDPWPTPLARAALDSGRALVSGLDLLAHQAVLQVDLMTGQSVPVELLREAGRAELARRAVRNSPEDR